MTTEQLLGGLSVEINELPERQNITLGAYIPRLQAISSQTGHNET